MESPVFWPIILGMEALLVILRVFDVLYVLAGAVQLADVPKNPPAEQAAAENKPQPAPPRD